jgi:hypothetical protein
MQGSETQWFRVAVASGQYLRIVVNQLGIDVAVALIGPGGERLVEVDSPNGTRGNEPSPQSPNRPENIVSKSARQKYPPAVMKSG